MISVYVSTLWSVSMNHFHIFHWSYSCIGLTNKILHQSSQKDPPGFVVVASRKRAAYIWASLRLELVQNHEPSDTHLNHTHAQKHSFLFHTLNNQEIQTAIFKFNGSWFSTLATVLFLKSLTGYSCMNPPYYFILKSHVSSYKKTPPTLTF